MPRKVFFSFHYAADNWRVFQVRNAGAIEGQPVLNGNQWETVQKQGDSAIERWINAHMVGRSCVVVLIGAATARRRWVNYEIEKGWTDGKGVVGIYIHGLLDKNGRTSAKGANPFSEFSLRGTNLDRIVSAHDPTCVTSQDTYRVIAAKIGLWVEEAIALRRRYA